jgi:hypothetical protein
LKNGERLFLTPLGKEGITGVPEGLALLATGYWATLAVFDLVRTDRLVWIQIYGHLKEGTDLMSEWIIFPRIYMMVSGPAEFFFWHFPNRGSGPLS